MSEELTGRLMFIFGWGAPDVSGKEIGDVQVPFKWDILVEIVIGGER
jgi:hypothetical protein